VNQKIHFYSYNELPQSPLTGYQLEFFKARYGEFQPKARLDSAKRADPPWAETRTPRPPWAD